MNKSIGWVVAGTIYLTMFVCGATIGAGVPERIVGPLQGPDSLYITFGCTFSDNGNESVFASSDTAHGWINLNGKDVFLKEAGKNEMPRDGKKSVWKYKAKDVSVMLELNMVSSGESGSSLDGTMDVTAGKQKQHLDISGTCGC